MMSIRSIAVVTALACLSLICSPVSWGQDGPPDRDRGGRPGGRFGGGPGGPGGMFGGRGGPQGGTDVAMFTVLGMEEVRTELEIMPDQKDALQKVAEKLRGERPDFDFRNASDEERQAFMEKMQAESKKRAEEAKAQLEEVLLPAQYERLQELAIQFQGARALYDPEVAKKLNMTSEQTEKLNSEMQAFGDSMRERMGELFRSGDRDSMRAKMQELRKEGDTKAMAVLTAEQKAEFEKMKGQAFTFPEVGFGGPGGFGGGPGGPGGFGGPRGERGGDRGERGERGRPEAE